MHETALQLSPAFGKVSGECKPLLACHALDKSASKRKFPLIWKTTRISLLSQVSMILEEGRLYYLMGPSGSGKTTLLTSVFMGGASVWRSDALVRSKFVPHNLELCAPLTVEEVMNFAAGIYVRDRDKRQSRISSILKALDLEKCCKTRVGDGVFYKGLSGGERKRLGIGIELLSDPQVLCIDEATTGLDAASSFMLARMLSKLAREMRTAIVLTIHQPSALLLDFADSVLLLAGGRVVYFGETSRMAGHFAGLGAPLPPGENLSDHVLEITSLAFDPSERGKSASLDAMISDFANTEEGTRLREQLTGIDWEYQRKVQQSALLSLQGLGVLLRRQVQLSVLDPRMWLLRMAVWVAMLTFTGSIWYQCGTSSLCVNTHVSYLWGVLAYACLVGVGAIPFRLLEREILARESTNQMYSASAFLVAQSLSDICLLFVFALAVTPIYYYMVGFTSEAWRFFTISTNLFLVLLVFEACMTLIAALVPNQIAALGLGVVTYGTFLLSSGFFVGYSQMGWWMQWLKFVNPMYYGFSANMIANFYNTSWAPACAPNGMPCYPSGITGEEVLIQYVIDPRLWVSEASLCGYFLLLKALSWGVYQFLLIVPRN